MRFFLATLTLLIPLSVMAQDGVLPSSPEKLDFPVDIWPAPTIKEHRHALPNGTVLYAVQSDALPRVSLDIGLWALDAPLPAGPALLCLYLSEAGPATLATGGFKEALARLGAVFEFRMVRTTPGLHLSVASEHFDAALRLVDEAVRAPRWDAALLKRCQAQLAQRQAAARLDFGAFETGAFLQRAGLAPADREAVDAAPATLETLKTMHRDFFHPRRLVVAAAGSFETTTVVERLSQTLDTIPLGLARPPIPEFVDRAVHGLYVAQSQTVEACGMAGFVATPVNDIDIDPVQIVSFSILADRLVTRIRQSEYIVPDIKSHLHVNATGQGYLGIRFRLPPEGAAKVIAWMIEEQSGLAQAGPARREVWDAQEKLRRVMRVHNAGAPAQARYLAYAESLRGLPISDTFLREGFVGIDVAQVQACMARQFTPDRIIAVVSGNRDELIREFTSWGLEKRMTIKAFELESR